MAEYTEKMQNTISRNFSKWIHSSETKFKDLVKTGMKNIGLGGREFDELENVQKIYVYCEIGELSGRGGRITTALKTALGIGGEAVILFTVAMMAWDIFSAERPIETAARDVALVAAPVAGAAIAGVVNAVVEVAFVDVEASVLLMVGIVSSFAGAFIVGAAAGLLIDLIFDSGATAKLNLQTHHCGVAALLDSQVIARQIAHQGIPPN